MRILLVQYLELTAHKYLVESLFHALLSQSEQA